MATLTRQRNGGNAGNLLGRVLVGVLVRLASGKAAALVREAPPLIGPLREVKNAVVGGWLR